MVRTLGVNQAALWLRKHWKLTIIFVLVAIYPFIDSLLQRASNYSIGGYTGTLVTVLMYAMLALGLNVVIGYAGLLDLGYAAFFAIGAYAMALLSTPHPPWGAGVPFPFNYFWVALLIAAGIGLFSGVILGAPTIPLRGDYLAIVTLGFGEIVPVLFRNLTCVTIPFLNISCVNLTDGEKGISLVALPNIPFIGNFSKIDLAPWYWLALLIIIGAIAFNHRLEHSRLGRAWMAMREDEDVAAAMGVDVVWTKLLAFAMGATFSGFAGAYYASYIQAVFPSSFDFTVSVTVLCAVILGGSGNPYGAILGGIVIAGIDRIGLGLLTTQAHNLGSLIPFFGAVDFQLWRYGLFGVALVIVMLVRPEGLLPNRARARELREAEEEENLSGIAAAEEPTARGSEAG
jgi:branched-chain amino acid transport system permease protein